MREPKWKKKKQGETERKAEKNVERWGREGDKAREREKESVEGI